MFKGIESLHNPEMLSVNVKNVHIADKLIKNCKFLNKIKSKPNLNLFISNLVLPEIS